MGKNRVSTKKERKYLLLTRVDAAKFLGVNPSTITRLARLGTLRAVRSNRGDILYIWRESLLRMLSTGKRVALYVSIRATPEDVEVLNNAAVESYLEPVYTIRESLPDISKPLVDRDGFRQALELAHDRKIHGMVAEVSFLARDANTLMWLMHMQRLAFMVYVREGEVVTPYPYHLEGMGWKGKMWRW